MRSNKDKKEKNTKACGSRKTKATAQNSASDTSASSAKACGSRRTKASK